MESKMNQPASSTIGDLPASARAVAISIHDATSPADRIRRRRWLRGLSLCVLVGFAALAVIVRLDRGIYVKVVNRTNEPMKDVVLVAGNARSIALSSIAPGRSAGAYIAHDETSDIRVVYRQCDGALNDVMRIGYHPIENLRCADKIVFGVMAHQTNHDPKTMRCYFKRHRRYDPAAYATFLPGGED